MLLSANEADVYTVRNDLSGMLILFMFSLHI